MRDRFPPTYAVYVTISAVIVGVIWEAKPHLFRGPASMQEVEFLTTMPCANPTADRLISCLRPSAGQQRAIWLIGDSHAGNLEIGLRKAADTLGVAFQFMTGRGWYFSLIDECTSSVCPEGSEADKAARLKLVGRPGDIVVLSFARDRLTLAPEKAAVFQHELSELVADLTLAHFNVVLVQDIPKVCINDLFYMRSAFRPNACGVSVQQSRREREVLSNVYTNISQRYAVTVVDPHDSLCERISNEYATCSNWLGGDLLYLDSSPHLTRQASLSLHGFFEDRLRSLVDSQVMD